MSTPTEPNIVQRIVNAWDCCGTCAGGVLAAHVAAEHARNLDRLAAVEAIRVDMERRAGITSSRYVRCKDVANALRYALEGDQS